MSNWEDSLVTPAESCLRMSAFDPKQTVSHLSGELRFFVTVVIASGEVLRSYSRMPS